MHTYTYAYIYTYIHICIHTYPLFVTSMKQNNFSLLKGAAVFTSRMTGEGEAGGDSSRELPPDIPISPSSAPSPMAISMARNMCIFTFVKEKNALLCTCHAAICTI